MPETSKPKRAYNSTRRQAQARQTRQQITEAARLLFTQHGYAGATIDSIAQEAGVAPETVYAVFGSKRKILSHLLSISVGGDDAPTPILERTEPRAVFQQTDQRLQLLMFARDMTAIMQRAAPVIQVMRIAAKTEPDIAQMLHESLNHRWDNLEALVRRVAENGPLREGIDIEGGTDIVWSLSSADVFLLLTVDRGWSIDQFIEWLADSLIRLLLP